ncbi:M48 family metallopeptidase [Atopomonas sediminilitoris]|uniref:M48 family metallopeptidase n=1 Tax=Atopomonas sediminilitoris TaxID=2919919 RepID=UPI001F4D69EF|nr:M48 family metallopeptidase [Atopomonas sediminilitoris]MCJ8169995.1 M48 family metallopeptidase [Atopomonas sediminilitoris]
MRFHYLLPAALALVVAGCQAVNTTRGGAVGVERQQSMLGLLSAQQVDQMYAQSYRQTLAEAGQKRVLNSRADQVQRLRTVSQRLIAQVGHFRDDAPGWAWEVNLVDAPEVNANCGPGGKILVYSGLFDQLSLTDDELAAVVGHEIAHALREHGREAMSKAYALEMAENTAGALLGLGQDTRALADTVAQYALTLPNSRTNEKEADLIGLELAARAGFDPRAALTLWQKMGQVGGGQGPEFMSTHPSSSTRMQGIEQALPQVLPLYEAARGQ